MTITQKHNFETTEYVLDLQYCAVLCTRALGKYAHTMYNLYLM